MREHTRLEISWAALTRNWEVIQNLAPRAQILPMIKANAYGHGLVKVGQFLHQSLKVKTLGVATLGEAETFLHETPRYAGVVLVFSDSNLTDPGISSRYQTKSIVPVIHEKSALEVFLSDKNFSHLPLVIKLNTGMNRLGLDETDWEWAAQLIVKSGRKSIQHLLTHFACSYMHYEEGDKTHRQEAAFARGLALFKAAGLAIEETSLANSGAIEQQASVEHTWVRPGLMLYGPGSFKARTEMISTFSTRILKVFEAKRGVPVGYGTHVPLEDGVMAVLPVGYGDGLPTQASGHKFQTLGFETKVFGRVNMDMAFLFFPKAAWGKIKAGDEIRFWESDPAAVVSWAEHMGTHPYQAMCGISGRVPRVYRLG
jgi:alanine racemase